LYKTVTQASQTSGEYTVNLAVYLYEEVPSFVKGVREQFFD